jgi:hypothetical protein
MYSPSAPHQTLVAAIKKNHWHELDAARYAPALPGVNMTVRTEGDVYADQSVL